MGKLAGLKQAVNRTKKLGGTTAERMARAKAMGFDTDTTYYHGTDKDFDAFKTGVPSKRYTTFTERDVDSQGVFLSSAEGDAATYGDNVMELMAREGRILKNPTNTPITSKSSAAEKASLQRQWDDIEYILEPAMYSENGTKYIDIDSGISRIEVDPDGKWLNDAMYDGRMDWDYLDNPEVVNRMSERGYNSVKVYEQEGDAGESLFVIDPSQIRSVNADFNPELKDSANLLAGVGGAAVLGGAMAPQDADAAIMEGVAMQGLAADWTNRRADKRSKWTKFKETYGEPAATIGTALASMPVQGLAGLGALAQGYGIDDAVGAMERTGEALTYMPKSEAGMESLQNVSEAMDILGKSPPAEFVNQHINQGADWAADNIHPAAGAALKTLPEVVF